MITTTHIYHYYPSIIIEYISLEFDMDGRGIEVIPVVD